MPRQPPLSRGAAIERRRVNAGTGHGRSASLVRTSSSSRRASTPAKRPEASPFRACSTFFCAPATHERRRCGGGSCFCWCRCSTQTASSAATFGTTREARTSIGRTSTPTRSSTPASSRPALSLSTTPAGRLSVDSCASTSICMLMRPSEAAFCTATTTSRSNSRLKLSCCRCWQPSAPATSTVPPATSAGSTRHASIAATLPAPQRRARAVSLSGPPLASRTPTRLNAITTPDERTQTTFRQSNVAEMGWHRPAQSAGRSRRSATGRPTGRRSGAACWSPVSTSTAPTRGRASEILRTARSSARAAPCSVSCVAGLTTGNSPCGSALALPPP
ncbi:unnamed protein product, partial [Phaeothamnion confervicola]